MRTVTFNKAIQQMKQDITRPILILVPFFSGIGLHAHGEQKDRRAWLQKSLKSLEGQGDIIVGTATREDYDYVSALPLDIKTMRIECPPEYLPYALCRNMQQSKSVYGYVLVSEGDIVHPRALKDIAGAVQNGQAIIPVRMSNGVVEQPQGPKLQHKLISGGWLTTADTFKQLDFTRSIVLPVKTVTAFVVVEQCKVLRHKKWVVINLSNEKEKKGE